jgi:hypothetical protein
MFEIVGGCHAKKLDLLTREGRGNNTGGHVLADVDVQPTHQVYSA